MFQFDNTDSSAGVLSSIISPIRNKNRILWENARFIMAEAAVDPSAAGKILPFGLTLDEKPAATLFMVHYRKTAITGPYFEAGLLLHVKCWGRRGVHCPWIVVNDDTAMVYGRELLGFPKMMGNLHFSETDKGIRAGLSRRGVDILEVAGVKKERQARPVPVFDRPVFNVGGPGSGFFFNPLYAMRVKERIKESHAADVRVTLNPSKWDPVLDIFTGEFTRGRMTTLDLYSLRYMFPVGIAGIRHFARNYHNRMR